MKPRVHTATPPTHMKVTTAIQASKSVGPTERQAVGARLSPITATTAPVTTGGISFSIHLTPVSITMRPTTQ